jgi:trimethylamine:corrinoid methyltransferase-like protein
MKTVFEVLCKGEVERIHAASMEVLETVGVKVDYAVARDLFRKAGAQVDNDQRRTAWCAVLIY